MHPWIIIAQIPAILTVSTRKKFQCTSPQRIQDRLLTQVSCLKDTVRVSQDSLNQSVFFFLFIFFFVHLLPRTGQLKPKMENLTTLVSCSSSPKLLIGGNFTSSLKPPVGFSRRTPKILLRRSKTSASSAQSHSPSENAGEIG